jgi:hypothetical protein
MNSRRQRHEAYLPRLEQTAFDKYLRSCYNRNVSIDGTYSHEYNMAFLDYENLQF